MNWTELLENIRDRSGATPDETRAVMAAFIEVAFDALEDGDDVVVPGLLKLSRRWQPARTLRTVNDQRKVRLDGRWVPRVKAARKLKAHLVQQTPQTWRNPAHQRAWRLAETLIDDLDLYHPDAAPELSADDDDDAVTEACAEAFGAAWRRALKTFEGKVDDEIRAHRNHLAHAARRRWARES